MEAAADFMRAGGRLSAELLAKKLEVNCFNAWPADLLRYSDCRDASLGSLSAAAVLLRRSLGGRTVPGRRRGAAADSPLAGCRRDAPFLCN